MIFNPDKKVVEKINSALLLTGGQCPCVPKYLWNEDTICPCKNKRFFNECHCKLYVKEDESNERTKNTK